MYNKKMTERICLEKTKAYANRIIGPSQKVLTILLGEIDESERPDFIIKNKKEIVGVEHFLVDTMIGKKKASRTRTRKSEITRTFEKYHEDLEGNEEDALKEVESIVQSDIDAIQNFEYRKFITELDRITNMHLSKVEEYFAINDGMDKIAFMIEIPIAKNKIICTNCKCEQEVIKGRRFPITVDIIRILKSIAYKVDYTIICIMHEDYKTEPYAVYAIDNSIFEESIATQLNDIYFCFTYDWQTNPFKTAVNLKLE